MMTYGDGNELLQLFSIVLSTSSYDKLIFRLHAKSLAQEIKCKSRSPTLFVSVLLPFARSDCVVVVVVVVVVPSLHKCTPRTAGLPFNSLIALTRI